MDFNFRGSRLTAKYRENLMTLFYGRFASFINKYCIKSRNKDTIGANLTDICIVFAYLSISEETHFALRIIPPTSMFILLHLHTLN